MQSRSTPTPLPPDPLAREAFGPEDPRLTTPAPAAPADAADRGAADEAPDPLLGDLTPEEALELSRAPYSRQLRRLIALGLSLLVAFSAGSWVVRTLSVARAGSAERLATFDRVLTESRTAQPGDLIELGQAWTGAVQSMREEARAGSPRRDREEIEAAGAGMGIAVRGTELLTDSSALFDIGDRLLVADLVQRISYDPVVRALTQLQRQYADTLLVRTVEEGVRTLATLRQNLQTAADAERAQELANRLATVLGETRGRSWRALADSLGAVATTQRLMGEEGEGGTAGAAPPGVRDSLALVERVRGSAQIQRYLTDQGINVTTVGVSSQSTTRLVVRGLAPSEELAVLLTKAPATRQRLLELGFTELQTEGTDGTTRWNLQTGARLAEGAR